MNEITHFINHIAEGNHLTQEEAGRVFQIIMNGGATPPQIAGILMGLRMNDETVDEITGAALAIRAKAEHLHVPEEMQEYIVDTCGTGGDKSGTYNISTAVALVVAACDVPVAKHGNKAVSSKSGSADVLTQLGINIDADKETMERALQECNICFMMAPKFHAAMRHVGPTRKELGMRTIFNLIGPLVNPASAKRQLLGVYSKDLVEPLAHVLKNLGSTHAWVVHGSDGLDELTVTGPSYVAELKEDEITTFTVDPEALGIELAEPEALVGGNAIENARAIRDLLNGHGEAYRDIVLLNAAASLIVAGKAESLEHGMTMAADAIDSEKAKETLAQLALITSEDLTEEDDE